MIYRNYVALSFLTFVIFFIGLHSSTGQIPQTPAKDSNIIEEFEFNSKSTNFVLLPVKMNDKTYQFLVDTGASTLIYDTSLKAQLGTPGKLGRVKTFHGDAELEMYDAPKALLGSLDLQTIEKVFCSDLSSISKSIGIEIKGIIGMSFLRKYIVHIDFYNGKLSFLKKLNSDPGWVVNISNAMPNVSTPSIDIKFPLLRERRLMIDTGANIGISLNSDIFDKLISQNTLTLTGVVNYRDGLEVRSCRKGIISELIINRHKIREVPVLECKGSEVLGLHMLRIYHCTFDFPENRVYLIENRK